MRAEDMELERVHTQASEGFHRCELMGRGAGSVHMGVGRCSLEPGGRVDRHLHSFEESFFVLDGTPTLVLDERTYSLEPGACGIVPVGVPHGWLGAASGVAQWIEMLAPQPRADGLPADTFFLDGELDVEPQQLDIRDPRSRHLFRLATDDMEVDSLKRGSPVDAPKVSASMATALLAYSGIAVKMLVDQRLDAQLSTMFMVEYQQGGIAQPHDHPFEESYFILEGEVEAVADGERSTLRPGDFFWTGVGCIHAFYNTSSGRVRWLETQAPQPPARHSYRFDRDWEYLGEKLGSAQGRPAESAGQA
jgi:quercetin dioxygenase-like cupin family protein